MVTQDAVDMKLCGLCGQTTNNTEKIHTKTGSTGFPPHILFIYLYECGAVTMIHFAQNNFIDSEIQQNIN